MVCVPSSLVTSTTWIACVGLLAACWRFRFCFGSGAVGSITLATLPSTVSAGTSLTSGRLLLPWRFRPPCWAVKNPELPHWWVFGVSIWGGSGSLLWWVVDGNDSDFWLGNGCGGGRCCGCYRFGRLLRNPVGLPGSADLLRQLQSFHEEGKYFVGIHFVVIPVYFNRALTQSPTVQLEDCGLFGCGWTLQDATCFGFGVCRKVATKLFSNRIEYFLKEGTRWQVDAYPRLVAAPFGLLSQQVRLHLRGKLAEYLLMLFGIRSVCNPCSCCAELGNVFAPIAKSDFRVGWSGSRKCD